jgi:hypothetical protein
MTGQGGTLAVLDGGLAHLLELLLSLVHPLGEFRTGLLLELQLVGQLRSLSGSLRQQRLQLLHPELLLLNDFVPQQHLVLLLGVLRLHVL